MRFTIAALIACAAALPQNKGCCCCDISRSVISCDANILASECICADVVCPKDAQTVYTPAATATAAATIQPGPVHTPGLYNLPTEPAAIQRSEPAGAGAAAPGPFDDACCCCDPRRNVIGCTRTIKKSECFCTMVACPAGAPFVLDDPPAAVSAA